MANALRMKYSTLTSMKVKVVGFEILRDLYKGDAKFGEILDTCSKKPFKHYVIMDGFLFKGNSLCIPSCFLRLSIIDEFHVSMEIEVVD